MKTVWPIKIEEPRRPPRRRVTVKPKAEETDDTPSVQIWGKLANDSILIQEKLKGLSQAESYHGDLQATLSAVRRMEGFLVLLIERVEDGRG